MTADSTTDSLATLAAARSIGPDLVALRRRLHQVPEIGLHLPLTQQLVLEALADLDVEVTTGTALSSVTAVLRGGASGPDRPVVLLRGDMDALPVTEAVPVPYISQHVGVMHACGHDLHVAALVGAARILHDRRAELAGDVVLMFQPGEEGPGGAEPMIAEGLLEAAGRPVDSAYALHVSSSEYPLGQWFARPGPVFAAADEVHVRVLGRGGHGSQPNRALDPVPCACEIVLALQTMVTRRFDVFDPVVIGVGRIAGGTKENIIPDDVEIDATVRTLSADARERVRSEIEQVVRGLTAAHGLGVDIEYKLGYPVTVNDAAEHERGRQAVVDLFGADRFRLMPEPQLGSEDMSFVLDLVPGTYFNVSACPDADFDAAPDNHSPRAAFDDAVLPDCAAWLAEMALRRLSPERG
ncbi:MAG TPA: M20 family metallopeptidase [Actinomycetes bacterium]|nr:M20 family metallopeptidase [Actinomycetes bacterium]